MAQEPEFYNAYRRRTTDEKHETVQAQYAPGAKLQSYTRESREIENRRDDPEAFVMPSEEAYARRNAVEEPETADAADQYAQGAHISMYGPTQTNDSKENSIIEQISQTPVQRTGAMYHYLKPQGDSPVLEGANLPRRRGVAEQAEDHSLSMPDLPIVGSERMPTFQPRVAQNQPSSAEQEQPRTLLSHGYQVESERKQEKGKSGKGKWLWILLAAAAVTAVAVLGFALFSGNEELPPDTIPTATQVIAASQPSSPAVRSFVYSGMTEVSDEARQAISAISGSVVMENAFHTAANVVTRNQREDGLYDFYVFDSQGRLLCYFDSLNKTDVFGGENGTIYARQKPYLLQSDGQPLIPAGQLRQIASGDYSLMPIHYGWSLIRRESDGLWNLVDTKGTPLAELWMKELFPFTGKYTLGCVDTGNTGSEERYIWYIFGQDGSSTRWFAAGQEHAVSAVFCNLAFLSDGRMYDLGNVEKPLSLSARAVVYPDLDAAVLWGENGKCGMWIQGKLCYDYAYNSIEAVDGELRWDTVAAVAPGIGLRVYTLAAGNDKRPVSCTFVLNGDQGTEYASLSIAAGAAYDGPGEFAMLSD